MGLIFSTNLNVQSSGPIILFHDDTWLHQRHQISAHEISTQNHASHFSLLIANPIATSGMQFEVSALDNLRSNNSPLFHFFSLLSENIEVTCSTRFLRLRSRSDLNQRSNQLSAF